MTGVRAAQHGARRLAFTVWAAILSLFCGLVFVGLTLLTISAWLGNRGHTQTNPVVDLGFFALGAVIIGTGFAAQLRAPEHHIAGLQQAGLGLLALSLAGLLGGRIEPLMDPLLFLLAAAILVALHPAGGEFFRRGETVSSPLVVLAILGAIPALAYAAHMLVLARGAGPSCFLGGCARGDRYAEMAAVAIAVVLLGLLAAARTQGWRLPAWSAGTAAIIVGLASCVLPDVPGSVGQACGALAVVWGVLFVAVAEWQGRRVAGRGGVRRVA